MFNFEPPSHCCCLVSVQFLLLLFLLLLLLMVVCYRFYRWDFKLKSGSFRVFGVCRSIVNWKLPTKPMQIGYRSIHSVSPLILPDLLLVRMLLINKYQVKQQPNQDLPGPSYRMGLYTCVTRSLFILWFSTSSINYQNCVFLSQASTEPRFGLLGKTCKMP